MQKGLWPGEDIPRNRPIVPSGSPAVSQGSSAVPWRVPGGPQGFSGFLASSGFPEWSSGFLRVPVPQGSPWVPQGSPGVLRVSQGSSVLEVPRFLRVPQGSSGFLRLYL